MSSPKVLRWFANAVEVLPGAIGQIACSGLALLLVGGCMVVMVREDPIGGWVLGGMAAYLIVPGVLRAIADAVERRSATPPTEDAMGSPGFRCASCGASWSYYHADCPDCGAVMEE